jgi:pheromone shutdown protein TraB
MTLCSLMLMLVLVVGATGYAGIRGLLSSTTTAAKAASVEPLKSAARPGRTVTPAAIALALIAVVFVVAADRAANPRRLTLLRSQWRIVNSQCREIPRASSYASSQGNKCHVRNQKDYVVSQEYSK